MAMKHFSEILKHLCSGFIHILKIKLTIILHFQQSFTQQINLKYSFETQKHRLKRGFVLWQQLILLFMQLLICFNEVNNFTYSYLSPVLGCKKQIQYSALSFL